MNFYDKYVRMCNEIGKSPSAVAVEAGTTKTAVNRWKNGSIPSDATLMKLTDYFGCSPDELRGDAETNTPPTTEDVAEVLQALRERPEMKMLFDAGLKANPETVKETARFLEGLAGVGKTD